MKRNFAAYKVRVKNSHDGYPVKLELDGYTIGRDGNPNWRNPVTITIHCHDFLLSDINKGFIETQNRDIEHLVMRKDRLKDLIKELV
jgi:hypothetical protein